MTNEYYVFYGNGPNDYDYTTGNSPKVALTHIIHRNHADFPDLENVKGVKISPVETKYNTKYGIFIVKLIKKNVPYVNWGSGHA